MTKPRIIRYIVQNDYEEIPASYNATLGKQAEQWAILNAKSRRSRIIAEYTDGTSSVFKDFSQS